MIPLRICLLIAALPCSVRARRMQVGYPSTAQLPDGKLVTVFYAIKSPLHDGYHMGAVGWTADALSILK